MVGVADGFEDDKFKAGLMPIGEAEQLGLLRHLKSAQTASSKPHGGWGGGRSGGRGRHGVGRGALLSPDGHA
jgi:hypothetical protein